jgi:hypothetical protein
MTIYLYKKTHNKTGLQYLGKTVQDPFKYRGSGDHWVPHIKKHGYDVTTEILRECQTNEEVKEWGLYYSELWNIVESRDWANQKPEEGQGFATGKHHHMKLATNREKMSVNSPAKKEKNRKKSAERGKIRWSGKDNPMRNPKVLSKHWLGKNNPSCRPEIRAKRMSKLNKNYDHTIYCWVHVATSETVYMTQYDFRTCYNISVGAVSNVVNRYQKSCKGWTLTKP